jgi:hypothetical protein
VSNNVRLSEANIRSWKAPNQSKATNSSPRQTDAVQYLLDLVKRWTMATQYALCGESSRQFGECDKEQSVEILRIARFQGKASRRYQLPDWKNPRDADQHAHKGITGNPLPRKSQEAAQMDKGRCRSRAT